ERDRARAITGLAKRFREACGGVALVEEPGLEVEAGREIDIRMARPRIAVDAAVLTAAVGVDRLRERKIGRVVARDDGSRGLGLDERLERGQRLFERAPAVVVPRLREGREAPLEV